MKLTKEAANRIAKLREDEGITLDLESIPKLSPELAAKMEELGVSVEYAISSTGKGDEVKYFLVPTGTPASILNQHDPLGTLAEMLSVVQVREEGFEELSKEQTVALFALRHLALTSLNKARTGESVSNSTAALFADDEVVRAMEATLREQGFSEADIERTVKKLRSAGGKKK